MTFRPPLPPNYHVSIFLTPYWPNFSLQYLFSRKRHLLWCYFCSLWAGLRLKPNGLSLHNDAVTMPLESNSITYLQFYSLQRRLSLRNRVVPTVPAAQHDKGLNINYWSVNAFFYDFIIIANIRLANSSPLLIQIYRVLSPQSVEPPFSLVYFVPLWY